MVAGKYSLQNLITYDPAEHSVVDLEVEPSADYVMSGDRHLLQLGAYENTIILKSDGFTMVHQDLQI
jgi:predicted nucleic acid-binding protein